MKAMENSQRVAPLLAIRNNAHSAHFHYGIADHEGRLLLSETKQEMSETIPCADGNVSLGGCL